MYIKFEIWDRKARTMISLDENVLPSLSKGQILRQSMCITDRTGKEWFFMDIGEMPNGDRFVVHCHKNRLEYYIRWLNKPSQVNQYKMLNFFNLRDVRKIGNAFEIGV